MQRTSKTLYQEIIKLEYETYNITGQSIWDQYLPQIPWNAAWKNIFTSHTWPENSSTLYTLLHYATRTNNHIYRWMNQKHLKTPKCKLCEKAENIKHLFINCKQNRKKWTHFQRYYQNLIQKDYILLQHILSISVISLPPKTEKLVVTQFDDTIIPTTNTIINIKNEMKTVIQIHYRQHALNNILDEFKTNFCINNTLCKLTDESLKLLI